MKKKTYYKNFGESLQSYRCFFELSQDELGSALKELIAARTISAWERGKREPDLTTLVDLAAFLQTTTDHLLGREINEELIASGNYEALVRVGRVRPFSEDQYKSYVKILRGFFGNQDPSKGK
jgi:DNA-binding XRE family transcriptional regulator